MNEKSSKKILSTTVFVAIIVLFAFSAMCTPVSAQPTEEEIKQAIDNGTAWLAGQQNPDGSWGTSYLVAKTAFAVKKLEHYCMDPKHGLGLPSWQDPACPYHENITRGFNYIFKNAQIIHISNQTNGNPDTDGDGIGVHFGSPHSYTAGIVLMAIAESNEQDKIVNVSGSEINGWTYHDIAVDTVDYLAFGQTDKGTGRGGWGYTHCNNGSCWSDNSNTGWVLIGLQYAESPKPEGFGLTIPPFVKDELNIWIDYIQCDVGDPCTGFGGSGYGSPCSWVNILKTGNLLKEMAFVGDIATTPRVVNATAYLCCHWNDTADPGWRPNHYQAMYTTMKGLTALKIHEICGIDWQAEFEQAIVDQQNADGSWSGCPYYCWGPGSCNIADNILCTEWALLTLQKVVPRPQIGNVTGGGWIESPITPSPKKGKAAPNNKATFGFVAHYADGATTPSGNLQYNDHVIGLKVHGNVTTLCVDKTTNTSVFSGTARITQSRTPIDGTYEVTAVDLGEPGRGVDTFDIKICDGNGVLIYNTSLYISGKPTGNYTELGGGNIQLHDP